MSPPHLPTESPPHLPLVVVDDQVLPPALDGGEGTHGHPPDGVGGDESSHHLALVSREVEADILKGTLLRAEGGSLYVCVCVGGGGREGEREGGREEA